MSGMEPLAAFGLVCNVMQAIQFTTQTVSLCKKAFSTGSPDPELGLLIDDSTKLYQDLVNSIQSTTPLTEDETKLLRIAVKTQQAALEVRAEAMHIISQPTKGNIVASIAGGIKAKLRQNNLDKLQKKLAAYQALLESGSLSLICKKTDALSLQQDTRFNDLDDALRNFIRSYSQGETRLEGLLAKHADSIKEAVRTENLRSQHTVTTSVLTELSRTRQDISGMLQRMATTPPKWQIRETFLKSLKYDSMKDRFEQIGQPYEGTYQWIMRGIRPWVEDGDVAISKDQNQNQPATASNCPHETATLDLRWQCFPCWAEAKSSRDKIYWIQGKPGSGKSTLMKFLVSEKSLWSGLTTSRSDPLIMSHFFWAAGHPVQKSLRGLLLAMLSQFLSANEEFLDDAIDHFPLAKSKHIHGDWSLGEAQELVEKCFAKSRRPIFVFLDGLDEAEDDGMAPQSLLSFITNRLAAIKTVKICVASRPEPRFKNHLAHAPTLHLHHLTQFDMIRYIHASLLQAEPSLEATPEFKRIVESLLEMACGVFLWVALTVKSLSRGLMNGDTPHEIHLRLIQMPKGLHSLYQDMWSRLNEDESVYREEAAMYINLVLDWFTEQAPGPVSLFHCLMASRPSIMEAILNGSVSFSTHELEGFLQETAKRIETRTAGLLEVGWGKQETDNHVVGFIHRSALEFFQNTAEGRQILQYDTNSSQERRMRIYHYVLAGLWAQVTGQYTRLNIWAGDFLGVLARLHEGWDKGDIAEDDALKIMSSCKRIYETEKLSSLIPWTAPPVADFAGVAALVGLPHLLSTMMYRGQLGFLKKPISTPYRIYLLIAALYGRHVGPGESVPKVVELLANDLLHTSSDYDGEAQGSGASESPGCENKKLHLIILLSILQNQAVWPTSILSLPEAIKYFTLKCISNLETKVLVILTRTRIGNRGNDDEYELHISLFGDRIMKTGVGSEMKVWVALEMNVVALVEYLLRGMIADSHDVANSETSRSIIDELKRKEFRLYEPHIKIRVFHVPGELTHHAGLADAKELRLREAASERDHGLIKSSLHRIRRDTNSLRENRLAGQYQVPKLTDCLRTLKGRSTETTDLGTFMKVMTDNPLNKMAEDFMASPPDRYEP